MLCWAFPSSTMLEQFHSDGLMVMHCDRWESRAELLDIQSPVFQIKDKKRGGCQQSESLNSTKHGNVNASRTIKRTEIHSKDSKLMTHFKNVDVSGWLLGMSIVFCWDRESTCVGLDLQVPCFIKLSHISSQLRGTVTKQLLVKMVLRRSRKVRWCDVIQQKHWELTLAV